MKLQSVHGDNNGTMWLSDLDSLFQTVAIKHSLASLIVIVMPKQIYERS